MAEVLGLAAGAGGLFSLAVDLGESAQKLKKLYHHYKEAPQFLADISFELDTFALMLHSIERDRQRHDVVASGIVDRCIGMCQRACEEIKTAVHKLETIMSKSSRRGKLIAALDHPSMLERRNELDRARQSLAFAHQLYSDACRRRTEELLLEKLDRKAPVLTYETKMVSHNNRSFAMPSQQKLRHYSNNQARTTIVRQSSTAPARRIRLQPWIISRVWEVSIKLTFNDFGFNVRSCHIVPHDSPIFEYCRLGSIAKVQALFDERRASPFDCSYNPYCSTSGTTVLAAAAESGNVELCRYLLDKAGGFPLAPETSQDAVDAYALAVRNGYGPDWSDAFEMYSLLLQDSTRITDDLVYSFTSWCRWCPDVDMLRLIKSEYRYEFAAAHKEIRVSLAWNAAEDRGTDLPTVFLEMLDQVKVDKEVVQAYDDKGRTALHLVANRVPRSFEAVEFEAWIVFTRDLLEHGADIHCQDAVGHTPLLTLLERASLWPGQALCNWARLLNAAGVDLQSYGSREMEYWHKIYPHGMVIHWNDVNTVGWEYGPDPTEWIVYRARKATLPVYEVYYATPMPGAWFPRKPFVSKICWRPSDEDELEEPWRWRKVRKVTVWSHRFVDRGRSDEDEPFPSRSEQQTLGLGGTQDDCDISSHVIRDSTRLTLRPRSVSQPRGGEGFDEGSSTGSGWLPMCHNCAYDGRRRFGFGWHPDRQCAKGLHEVEYETWFDRIKEETRRFRYRYQDKDELRALPYSAYRSGWVMPS